MRHLIFRSQAAKVHLCVVDARDRRHALKVARRTFKLDKTAYAIREDGVFEHEPYTPTSGYCVRAPNSSTPATTDRKETPCPVTT
ncbi:MAG: hypothetical protein WC326_08300 [Candidatus Delongbacteria bacterium]